MATTRTFLAIEVSEAVRSRAADLIARLRASEAKVSWVDRANMHITLKFLGDQSDNQVATICRSVQQAAAEVPVFGFECRGAGAFPRIERPRTVWMGVTDGVEPFRNLHAALEAALDPHGHIRDRRGFTPHLTLGRVRSGGEAQVELGQLISRHAEFAGGLSEADEVVVFASHLRRSGAEYEVLARAPLQR